MPRASDTLPRLYARANAMARRAVVPGWTADDLAHELREEALHACHEWHSLTLPGGLFRFVVNRLADHLAYVKERAERGLPPAHDAEEWSGWDVACEELDMTPSEAQYHHSVRRRV